MRIMDSKSYCPHCGGCGVLFQNKALRCEECGRFENDFDAASAVGELVRAMYIANLRSQDLREERSCGRCPCHLVDTDEMGVVIFQRCAALDEELGHPWHDSTSPRCPLRGFKPTLLCE
jgi:hypothetical protein